MEVTSSIGYEIDIGIAPFVASQAGRTDFENARYLSGSVLQMVSVFVTGNKTCAIAGAENFLIRV
jgi:hypothetical protein